MIDSLVKCVLLYDDKLVITFNFKNEPVTVPTSYELEAIEGSSDIEAFASPKQKDTPCECPFVLVMRSAQEPTQNARVLNWVRIPPTAVSCVTRSKESYAQYGERVEKKYTPRSKFP